jgi:hypothetical protein
MGKNPDLGFVFKILTIFDPDADPGSCQPWIQDTGLKKSDTGFWIWDKHPESTILPQCSNFI